MIIIFLLLSEILRTSKSNNQTLTDDQRRRADVIGEDAKESVRIIEAANKSAVSGKEIIINGQ